MAESKQSTGARLLHVSIELLRDVLHLPEDVQIADARLEWDRAGTIALVLKSDQFTPISEGTAIPWIRAIYRSNRLGCGCDQPVFERFE